MFPYKSRGFTLVEVLINLSILSMLLILITPFAIDGIKYVEDQQFLNQLSHDILYIQSLAMNDYKHNPRIIIRENKYEIHSPLAKQTKTIRKIPNEGSMHSERMRTISFTINGTIQRAGTITLTLSSGTYSLIIPPGKGREHIVKQ